MHYSSQEVSEGGAFQTNEGKEKGTKWGRFQIKQIRQEIENLKEWNTFHSPEIDAEIKRETKVKFRTLLELKRVRSEICQKCRGKITEVEDRLLLVAADTEDTKETLPLGEYLFDESIPAHLRLTKLLLPLYAPDNLATSTIELSMTNDEVRLYINIAELYNNWQHHNNRGIIYHHCEYVKTYDKPSNRQRRVITRQ